MKKIIFIWFLLLSIPSWGSMDFIRNGFGARTVGMGSAYTALAQGPESVFYNVAALPALSKLAYKIEQGQILETQYYSLCAENILDIQNIRIGYIFAKDSGIPFTALDSGNQPALTGSYFNYQSHFMVVSYANEWSGFAYGIGLTGYYEQLALATAYSASLGFSLRKEWISDIPIRIGFSCKNIVNTGLKWSSGKKEPIPLEANLGVSISPFSNRLHVAVDMKSSLSEYTANKWQSKLAGGIEYWLMGEPQANRSFVLRTGYADESITLGMGLYVSGLLFDFAYILPQRTYLEASYRFSVGYSFFPFEIEPRKKGVKFSQQSNFIPINRDIVSHAASSTQLLPNQDKTLLKTELPANPKIDDLAIAKKELPQSYGQINDLPKSDDSNIKTEMIAMLKTLGSTSSTMPTGSQQMISKPVPFLISGLISVQLLDRTVKLDLEAPPDTTKIKADGKEFISFPISNEVTRFYLEVVHDFSRQGALTTQLFLNEQVFYLTLNFKGSQLTFDGFLPERYQLYIETTSGRQRLGNAFHYVIAYQENRPIQFRIIRTSN